jgi:hypothetical protein
LAGLPEFHCAVKDACEGVAEYRWASVGLVAAWWFVSSGVWLRLSAEEPIDLGVDIQDGMLTIMLADCQRQPKSDQLTASES